MPEDTIAGYRILRKLGSGSRAEVYLGHAAALASSGVNATAALKCFRADAPDESIFARSAASTIRTSFSCATSRAQDRRHRLSFSSNWSAVASGTCLRAAR